MEALFNLFIALFAFNFIIFFHELFHFLMAKALKIQTSEFAVGIGKSLVVFQDGKLRFLPPQGSYDLDKMSYHIRLFPIGGYVLFDRTQDSESETSFTSHHPFKRILVYLAGPVGNFFLGYVVLLGLIFQIVGPLSLQQIFSALMGYVSAILECSVIVAESLLHIEIEKMGGAIGAVDQLQSVVPEMNQFFILFVGINVMLGIANLILPFSITDGGRIISELICWIRGKRSISTKYADLVSFALMVTLFLVTAFLDVQRIFERFI